MTSKFDDDAYVRDARMWQIARMERGSDDPDVNPPVIPADPTIDTDLNVSLPSMTVIIVNAQICDVGA
jgi:hypothetical protein